MSGKEYYFQTEHLTVGYDKIPVLSNVCIHLERGEILSLIGPNGVGKTTLLKSMIGQLRPISGTVMIEGVPLSQISAEAMAKKVAIVPTDRLRTEMMTVEDVVETGRYPYTGKFGILGEKDRKVILDAMEMAQVSKLKTRDFTKISDGQRQRVMLARALAQEPDMILLDEPTSFLDIKYKAEFLSVLQKLSKEKHMTVIMSLHEIELAQIISDKIACFKNGELDRYGAPGEIFSDHYISELYNIRPEELTSGLQAYINEIEVKNS